MSERQKEKKRHRKIQKESSTGKYEEIRISLRSADAICSLVVKGRNVGSVCANSCELTAYIGLPFCSFLASPHLALHHQHHRVSVFVRLYPRPFFSLRYYCAPRIPRAKTGERLRS